MPLVRELPASASFEEILIAQGYDPADWEAFVARKRVAGLQAETQNSAVAPSHAIRLFETEYLKTKAQTTAETYRGVLGQFQRFMNERWRDLPLAERTVCQVTTADVEDFLASASGRRGEAKAQTVNKHLAVLRALFTRFLIRRKRLLQWDPSKALERLPEEDLEPVFLRRDKENDEQARLLDLARSTRNGFRDHTILFTMLNTGLRVSEVVSIRLQDIDFRRGFLQVKGKGGKVRRVPLLQGVAQVLQLYVDFRTQEGVRPARGHGDYLFLNSTGTHRGRRMTRDGVERMARPLFDRLGRPGVNVHALRHTFAVNLLDKGVHLEYIRVLLGHATVETTRRYLRLGDPKIKAELQKHFPFAVYMPPHLKALFGSHEIEQEVTRVAEIDSE